MLFACCGYDLGGECYAGGISVGCPIQSWVVISFGYRFSEVWLRLALHLGFVLIV